MLRFLIALEWVSDFFVAPHTPDGPSDSSANNPGFVPATVSGSPVDPPGRFRLQEFFAAAIWPSVPSDKSVFSFDHGAQEGEAGEVGGALWGVRGGKWTEMALKFEFNTDSVCEGVMIRYRPFSSSSRLGLAHWTKDMNSSRKKHQNHLHLLHSSAIFLLLVNCRKRPMIASI